MSNTSGNTTVDQRIVEMRIDNEKFEAGAKKTIGILESLDRSLKGLGQENADGFDKIGNSLDKVTDRFSAMGIVGDQVMRNLTNKAMEFVGQFKNVTTMLTTQQIDAGWNKYADKTQAIQTIMAATSGKIEEGFFANQAEQLEWVNEQIEKLNKFTDETSYNFLDMVGNIGKFTAAGRELEESVTAMEGIANWAAISGGRPAEASRAMYNLSQALGMGAVTVQDWKSIENANMATYEFKQQVIDTAEKLGTLRKVAEGTWEVVNPTTKNADVEVTVENFRGALAQKWFNSDVLLTVLNRYGEFSDKLIETVNNFEDLEITVTDYLKMLKAFKNGGLDELRNEFELTNEEIEAILPSLKELSVAEYDLGFRAFQAAQEAKTFTEAIDATKDAVSTKWMTVFELLFGNYLEAKELWTQMAEVFWDIFASPVDHLIDIIKGAGGFFGEEGFVGEFSDNLGKAAGSTAVLEDRLTAVGKTMKDFHKALEKTLGPNEARKIIDAYGTLDEALFKGGISAEQFKKALGELDDTFENTKTVSLNRALNKAGKTMTDFEKAIEQVGDQAALDLIENFGGIEEALKRGGISIDLFKQALESLGIDSENVSENIEENAISAVGSIEEMRELALEVLRGDHGNGDERLAWYESMGLDPELMQAMVGNIKNIPRAALDDDYLMELMESYYQAQHLSARLGYETFAEYLASCTGAAQDFVYDMNTMADEADDIYASLFGEGVLNAAGEYVSAGELFRKSLSNLLEALDKFGTAFDKAFMKVFGGADKYDDQVSNLSDGFFTLTAAFYSFSEKVLAFSKSDTFLNFMTAFFSITRLIGKALGIVFKVGKAGLSLVLKLLSPVLRLLTGLFEIISTGLDTMSRTLEDLDIFGLIDALGDSLLNKISEPIEKIIKVIDKLIEAFKEGFAEGGIESGLRNMYDTFKVLFQNHPVILAAVRILGKAFLFLKSVIEGLTLAFGGIIGGAVMGVIAVFQKLGEWFGKFVIWAQDSELLKGIWESIVSTFKKIGDVIKRVYGYAEKGYKEGGFVGAFQAVIESFKRGVIRLVPYGEQIISLFETIGNTLGNLFKRNKKDENGELKEAESGIELLEKKVADTSDGLLRLTSEAEEIMPKVQRAAEAVDTVVAGAFGTEEEKESFKDKVSAFIQTLWDGILKGLSQIKISDVIGALRLSLIASIATSILNAITVFKDIGRAVKSIPATFTEIGERFGKMMQGLAATFTANAVLKFAGAALIIAFALKKLSVIPKEDLTHAASVLIVILGVLAIIAKYISKANFWNFKSLTQLPNMATTLFGLSNLVISLAIAVVAFTVIQNLGPDKFKEAVKTIGILLGVVGGIVILVEAFMRNTNMERIRAMGKLMTGMGLAFVLIGIGIRKLATSIVMLSLIQNMGIEKFNNAASVVGILLLLVAGIVAGLIFASKNIHEKDLLAMGHMMLRIAASLIIVAIAIQMLTIPIIAIAVAASKYPDGIQTATSEIMGILLIISLISFLLMLYLNHIGYSNMEHVGKTMMMIAASMIIVAAAVGLITKPLIRIAELAEEMHDWHIIKSIGYIALVIGELGAILVLMNRFGGMNGGDGMLKAAGAMALLAVAMLLLTPAVVVLSVALGAFAVVLAELPDDIWTKFAKGLKRVLAFAGTIFLFGAALFALGAGTVAAGAGMVTIAGGIFLLIAALAILLLAVPKFVEMLQDLKDTSGDDLRRSLKKVAGVLMVVTAGIIVFSLVLSKLLNYLGPTSLKSIGSGFVDLIKGIVSSLASGVSNGFTKVSEYLQDPKNRSAILAALKTVIVIAAAYVADLIPTLVHVIIGGIVDLLNAIATEIDSQAPEIVEALHNIVSAIVKIVASLIDDIFGTEIVTKLTENEELLNRVTGAAEGIGIAIAALKLTKPFVDLTTAITGSEGVIAAFSSVFGWLILIGALVLGVRNEIEYLKEEAEEVNDVKEQRLYDGKDPSIEERIEKLKELKNTIAEVDEEINEMGSEGKPMEEINAKKIDRNNYETDLAREEETIARLISDATGERYKRVLRRVRNAENITELEEYKKYQEILAETIQTQEELTEVTEKQASVSEKQEAINEKRRLANARASANNVEKEAIEETKDAVNELVAAETNLEVQTDAVAESSFNLFDMIKESAGSFNLEDIFSTIGLDAGGAMDSLKGAFAEQGFNINDFVKSDGTGFDTEKITSLINVEQLKTDLKTRLSSASGAIPEGVKEGITDNVQPLIDGAGSMKDTLVTSFLSVLGINSPSRVFADEAGAIPEGVALGMQENHGYVTGGIINMLYHMLKTFDGYHNMFVSSGASIVQGMIDGIQNNLQAALIAGENLGTTVMNGFRSKLDIHSPSRVFMSLARYIPEGVAQGIADNEDVAVTEIVGFGSELIDAITSAMAQAAYVASDDFSISPTITPVVDVSNAKMAAGSVSSMFNKSYGSYVDSITARAGDVSQTVDYNLQNKEMVSEVRALSQRLDQLGESITNMQIVLDSGVMVGAMTPQLDMQLGKMAVRKGRGN